jgi:lipoate-protein ligase A
VEALTCRTLPYAVADGPHNMAADEVLLESAAAGTASLRYYGWSEATLSLGYFQPEQVRRRDARLAGLPYVRRPTGGATLIHHHELTYALALPAGCPWQPPGQPVASWLGRVHAIIGAALGDLGVRSQCGASQHERAFTGFLCFQHLTAGDVLIGKDKIVGSAQRRLRGALLQHGAILLSASPHAPVLPGICELGGIPVTIPELIAALRLQWVRHTGWVLYDGDWNDEERWRLEQLAEHKYRQESWNAKR